MNFANEKTSLLSRLKESKQELKRVPSLVGTALLTALNVIVGTFSFHITPMIKIGFTSVVAGVCGMYYGPFATGLAGIMADTLKFAIKPDGPYFPGYALNEFLVGFIYGAFFYKKEITLPRVIIARACITIFINLGLGALWLNILYDNPLFTSARLIKNVVMFPFDCAILYAVLKGAERIRKPQR